MNRKRFWGAIFRPGNNLKELANEPSFKGDLGPGLALMAWVSGLIGLLGYLLAWVSHFAISGMPGIVGTILQVLDQNLPLSPLSALLELAKTYAVQACAALAMAWCLDWAVRKWWKPGPARWPLFFNAATHAIMPLVVLMIIPVLGMLAAAVLACVALFRLASQIYAPGSWQRTLGGLVGSCMLAALAAWVLSLVLGLVISPLESIDPLNIWQQHREQTQAESAMEQAFRHAAPAPLPTPSQMLTQAPGPQAAPNQPAIAPRVPSHAKPAARAVAEPARSIPQAAQPQAVAAAPAQPPVPTVAPTAAAASPAVKVQDVNDAMDTVRSVSRFFH